jgi:endogenous inhibitor of DNA gyrase (YacG/DUF329 family)
MTCPVCKKPGSESYRPFCSKRCADVDLGRWLTGGYALPGEAVETDDVEDNDRPGEGGSLH